MSLPGKDRRRSYTFGNLFRGVLKPQLIRNWLQPDITFPREAGHAGAAQAAQA